MAIENATETPAAREESEGGTNPPMGNGDGEQGSPSDARRWGLNEVIQITNCILLLLTLVVLFFTLLAYSESLDITRESLDITRDSLDTTRESLRQNNLATIYSLSQTAHSSLERHPEMLQHFDESFRDGKSSGQLLAEYQNADLETRARIRVTCEQIADFMQLAFTQRDTLPPDDWDTWWAYFGDAYDESPVLRKFLKERPNWYNFTPILADCNERKKYFRGFLRLSGTGGD